MTLLMMFVREKTIFRRRIHNNKMLQIIKKSGAICVNNILIAKDYIEVRRFINDTVALS